MSDMKSVADRYGGLVQDMEEMENSLRRYWNDAAGERFAGKWRQLLEEMTECRRELEQKIDRDEV